MTTDRKHRARKMTVGGIAVAVVRKPIKSLRFTVHPPHGAVRVSVPKGVSDDVVRLAIIDKLPWIKRQRATFEAQPRQSAREMVNGETHFVLGRACRLRVVEHTGVSSVGMPRNGELVLHVRRSSSAAQRERALQRWYRERLRELLPPLVAKWERLLGAKAAAVGIKRMKTRWGTCNPTARRIWVNLELAKKPTRCLEYIVAHELAHLVDHRHGARFVALLDRHLPRWKIDRRELNATPLAHEDWSS